MEKKSRIKPISFEAIQLDRKIKAIKRKETKMAKKKPVPKKKPSSSVKKKGY